METSFGNKRNCLFEEKKDGMPGEFTIHLFKWLVLFFCSPVSLHKLQPMYAFHFCQNLNYNNDNTVKFNKAFYICVYLSEETVLLQYGGTKNLFVAVA